MNCQRRLASSQATLATGASRQHAHRPLGSVGHTGTDGFQRLAHQALFSGTVNPEHRHFVVGAFIGQGGIPRFASQWRRCEVASRPQPAGRRCKQLPKQAPEVPITLGFVAELVCLERTYCCKVFREIAGQSFRSWVRRIRVSKAAELLRTTNDSITAIAQAVGIPDITTFERRFRQELNMCPTAYRRRC
jgi:AraC-like DNA-binding protein